MFIDYLLCATHCRYSNEQNTKISIFGSLHSSFHNSVRANDREKEIPNNSQETWSFVGDMAHSHFLNIFQSDGYEMVFIILIGLTFYMW